jgi:hypothetical protein
MNNPDTTESAVRESLAQLANEVLLRHPSLICVEVQMRTSNDPFAVTLFARDAFGERHCAIGGTIADAEQSLIAKVKPAMQLAREKRIEAERLLATAEQLEASCAA